MPRKPQPGIRIQLDNLSVSDANRLRVHLVRRRVHRHLGGVGDAHEQRALLRREEAAALIWGDIADEENSTTSTTVTADGG